MSFLKLLPFHHFIYFFLFILFDFLILQFRFLLFPIFSSFLFLQYLQSCHRSLSSLTSVIFPLFRFLFHFSSPFPPSSTPPILERINKPSDRSRLQVSPPFPTLCSSQQLEKKNALLRRMLGSAFQLPFRSTEPMSQPKCGSVSTASSIYTPGSSSCLPGL